MAQIGDLERQQGQSLLEVIVVIAILVIVVTFAVQLIVVVLRGGQVVGDRDVGLRVAEEMMDGVFAISIERWDDIYGLTQGTTEYHTEQAMGKWTLVANSDVVSLNGVDYTRAVTFQHVCRSTGAGRDILGITDSGGADTACTGSGGSHDPTIQRATVSVTWKFIGNVTIQEHVFRWRNEVCPQTEWNTTGLGPQTCVTTEYETAVDLLTGTSLEVQ